MLNQPNCHTSLAEEMLLDIYTVLLEASQMKTNNAFSVLVIKLSRFSSHLTRLGVAYNRIRRYARKQTRQTGIEFTFRESSSAHCLTTGKSATMSLLIYFVFHLILGDYFYRGCSLAIAGLKFPRKMFVHIHIPRKNISGRKRKKQNKTNNLLVLTLYILL